MDPKHPDRLTAMASGFVAVMALAVSSYNVYLQRQQVRAQVWPRLQWMHNNVGTFAYLLCNNGVGPAEIRNVKVTVDGKRAHNWGDVFQLLSDGEPATGIQSSSVNQRVLGPGTQLEAMRILDANLAAKFNKQQSRVSVELCYCSALGDCWKLHEFHAEPVSRCPRYDVPFED